MKTTMTTGQLAKFLELLDQKGITPETFQTRLTNGVLADIFDSSATFQDRDQWRNAFGLDNQVPDKIILPVDYTKSLEEMIAAGNYDEWRAGPANICFPIVGEGIVEYEFKYVHSNENETVSSETAVNLIKKEDIENPWEPAKIEHLLAFGAALPDEQRKITIVALGSVDGVDGSHGEPFLSREDSLRVIGRKVLVSHWGSYIRFLAVRKVIRDSVS